MDYKDIITIEPGKRGGKPCIRGMRITVYDVLEYLASGMTVAEILDDFPYLTETDIRACLAYAADREKAQMVIYANDGMATASSSVGWGGMEIGGWSTYAALGGFVDPNNGFVQGSGGGASYLSRESPAEVASASIGGLGTDDQDYYDVNSDYFPKDDDD